MTLGAEMPNRDHFVAWRGVQSVRQAKVGAMAEIRKPTKCGYEGLGHGLKLQVPESTIGFDKL